MLHGQAVELGEDKASEKKAKLGIILFLVYLLLYATFVFIALVYTDLMGLRVFFGLNLGVTFGMGLILLAMIKGFIYNLVCTKMENEMNKEANV